MDMENVRITKQLRGGANRAANCDMHNTEKTIGAAGRQLQAIAQIEKVCSLDALPPALSQIARARKEHTEASLEELGQLMDPPLGKSSVNHRMRRLEAYARTVSVPDTSGKTP